MERHIMLLFLSDVKVNRQTKMVDAVEYKKIGPAKTTNESAVRYLLQAGYEGKTIRISRMFLFASKMIRKEISAAKDIPYRDEEGKSWTHLEYFKERLREIIPDIDMVAADAYPYDEDAPIGDAMQMVLDMAERIRTYVDELPENDRIILHADCTGGLRHANIMMLAVMRLMQYQRIDIGKVLYSRFYKDTNTGEVQEADDIYSLFNLISGAEEFVRFGSVSAIWDYYKGKEVSAELKELLTSMRRFAEEIRLCHYGSFREAIDNLRCALQAFQQVQEERQTATHGEKVLNNRLMEQLQGRVLQEYGKLLDEGVDDIELIYWCLKHGYFQQAMTLYTERVPEIICEHRMVFPANEEQAEILDEAAQRDTLGRSRNFYLINEYGGTKIDSILTKQRTDICSLLKHLFGEAATKEHDSSYVTEVFGDFSQKNPYSHFVDQQAVTAMFCKIMELKKDPAALKNPREDDTVLRRFIRVYRKGWEKQFRKEYEKKNGRQCTDSELSAEWDKKFLSVPYGKMRYNQMVRFFTSNAAAALFLELFSDVAFEYAYRLVYLREEGKIEFAIPTELLRDILNRYGTVKGERNHSNHAKLNFSAFTADDLRDYMMDGLKDIERACQMAKT